MSSHCVVPSWDNNNNNTAAADTFNNNHPDNPTTKLSRNLDSSVPNNSALEVPRVDYEVAELTWENGQLALHGLGQPRTLAPTSAPWQQDKQLGSSGMLESIVNQATCFFNPSFNDKPVPCFPPQADELVPWFNHRAPGAAASAAMTMDAMVPLCSNNNNNNNNTDGRDITCDDSNAAPVDLTHVESCSAGMNNSQAEKQQRQVPVVARDWNTRSEYSANSSRQQFTMDNTCTDKDRGTTGFTSTSLWSADNTSSGMPCTQLTGDSICYSRSIMKDDGSERCGEKKKKGSSSAKRSRAADIHNQSERKRRDRINQRMKTLQKMVPNSNKTDKASMLDEVIEHLKQLQAQVAMINRMNMNMNMSMNMNMPHMTMMPMTLNQQALHHQMSMISAMGMGNMAVPLMHPSPFLNNMPPSWDPNQPMMMRDPMSAFLPACPSQQPMTMESYRMMASIYQQMQQALQAPNS